MAPPPGIAKFDSAAAMTQSLAHFLNGEDFSGLGQPSIMQAIVQYADLVPRDLREKTFATMGAREGIEPDDIEKANMAEVAKWLTGLYPQRRYPAIMLGSSNGALVHLCAALGIPWLPQTILTLVKQHHVHPDDPTHAMETERETARRFLTANPDSQLHHMHDPSQDRLMLGLITYYRSKYLKLPLAYHEFISNTLEPGGTIYLTECNRRWPTKKLGDRYFYQFGAEGGPTTEEYFEGSERVADYLERYGSPRRQWNPPKPDFDSPEAEWGFEPAIRDEVVDLARRKGYRVVRLQFDDPEQPSPLIADLYRDWYRKRDLSASRLVVESFILHEPYWALRTGSVPYWMTFNMQPSLDNVNRYLDEADAYDEIYLMLFAHGVDSVGLPSMDAWRALLERARKKGDFLGLEPKSYPAHFAHFARYSQELREQAGARHPLPAPMPLEQAERFIHEEGPRHGVQIKTV